MKKSLFYIVVAVCCLVAVGLYTLFVPVVSQEDGIIYDLHAGISRKHVIEELSQQKIIQVPILFSLLVYSQPSSQLKAGEYLFPRGATLYSIWKQITSGTGLAYHPFTIIPGWSFTQLRLALLQTEKLNHLLVKLDDQQLMAALNHPELAPEGEFFPETYYYTKGSTDLVILKRAFNLMQNKLNAAWQNRQTGLPYKSAYEALIAASLIEKEAYLKSERAIIAGVLVNRLHTNMLLQFDPTVIYGMGANYSGKIHRENLLADTPYNTYVHKGLPPTPIAMPSIDSINAVMHPQANDYYYFVAKGDGGHQFSKTLPEHHVAVAASIAIKEQTSNVQTEFFNETKVKQYLHNLLTQGNKNDAG